MDRMIFPEAGPLRNGRAPAGAPFQFSFKPVLNEGRLGVSRRTQSPLKCPTVSGGNEPVDGSERPMGQRGTKCASRGREERGTPMKKVLIALVATLVAVSVAGCAGIGKGKGKAPPPIVTKG